MGGTKSATNDLHNAIRVFQNIVVPESQDAIAALIQPVRSHGIFCGLFAVLSAVHFDNEPCIKANEVDDIGTDWCLAAEAMAVNLPAPQLRPQH